MEISKRLKRVNISDIKPYGKNAKLHTNEQVDLIRRSLETYGYYSPIGVSKDNVVVFGHGRLEAMKAKGETEIEVVDLSNLSSAEIKKLRILDNKIVSNEWDDALLQEEIERIAEECDQELDDIKKELLSESKGIKDYSELNKEIDIDNFDDYMELKIKLSEEDYKKASSVLLQYGENINEGFRELINAQV